MATMSEQWTAATRMSLESQVALMTNLSAKAFEGVQKLIDLNVTAARSTLDESTATMRQLMSAKDPQEFLSMSSAQAQPTIEKALSYGRHLASIASSTQAELARTTEEQITTANRRFVDLMEQATQNAPAGSENVLAMVRSAIGNANAGYEQFSRTSRQAADAMQANVANAMNQFSQPAPSNGASASNVVADAAQQVKTASPMPAATTSGRTR
ncbi:MAG: TIGR01841 family phasin [Burkholderiaceae bacterium]